MDPYCGGGEFQTPSPAGGRVSAGEKGRNRDHFAATDQKIFSRTTSGRHTRDWTFSTPLEPQQTIANTVSRKPAMAASSKQETSHAKDKLVQSGPRNRKQPCVAA